jgi:myo-inositol-1(or 4)-monophosphatase
MTTVAETPGELRDLAVAIAESAGRLLRQAVDQVRLDIGTKSSTTDMVTEVDRAAEQLIVGRILEARPKDSILGEEGSERSGSSGVRWIVDPLDGTTNFIYRIPAYAVSIAVERDGVVVAGAVHDAPHNATFAAALGEGATLAGLPIGVSKETSLARSLVGTGFGYEAEVRREQGALIAAILPQVRDIRRAGSAALDLCSVACGRLDAYFERSLQPWDRAAGELIVAEAGGRHGFLDLGGAQPAVVAAGPAIFDEFVELLTNAHSQRGS